MLQSMFQGVNQNHQMIHSGKRLALDPLKNYVEEDPEEAIKKQKKKMMTGQDPPSLVGIMSHVVMKKEVKKKRIQRRRIQWWWVVTKILEKAIAQGSITKRRQARDPKARDAPSPKVKASPKEAKLVLQPSPKSRAPSQSSLALAAATPKEAPAVKAAPVDPKPLKTKQYPWEFGRSARPLPEPGGKSDMLQTLISQRATEVRSFKEALVPIPGAVKVQAALEEKKADLKKLKDQLEEVRTKSQFARPWTKFMGRDSPIKRKEEDCVHPSIGWQAPKNALFSALPGMKRVIPRAWRPRGRHFLWRLATWQKRWRESLSPRVRRGTWQKRKRKILR